MDLKLLLISFQLIGTCLTSSNSDVDKRISEIFTLYTPPSIQDSVQASPIQESVTTGPIAQGRSYKNCGIGEECVPKHFCPNAKIIRNEDALREDGRCPFLQTCCSIDDEVNEQIDEPSTSCGYQTPNSGDFLDEKVHHDQAKFGEFPWMVGITAEFKIFNISVNLYLSGGSLIAPDVVLTAAHKVYIKSANKLKVCAGICGYNNDPSLKQYRRVREIIVHEAFNATNLSNDIALLFLETPFEMGPSVRTICLPPAGLKFDPSNECLLSNWCSVFKNGQHRNILRKTKLSVMPNNQCPQKFNGKVKEYFKLQSNDLCAGGRHHKGDCTGVIGGSPLVCRVGNEPNRFFQAGIATMDVGYKNTHGVYGSVPQFRTWIDEQLISMTIEMTPR